MARVDINDVLEVLDTEIGVGMLAPLIQDASAWVDQFLSNRLSETTLTAIEKYLAAHMAIVAEDGPTGPLTSAKRADISETYAQRGEAGGTNYLRIAAAYDSTGILAEHWLGKRRARGRVGVGYAG